MNSLLTESSEYMIYVLRFRIYCSKIRYSMPKFSWKFTLEFLCLNPAVRYRFEHKRLILFITNRIYSNYNGMRSFLVNISIFSDVLNIITLLLMNNLVYFLSPRRSQNYRDDINACACQYIPVKECLNDRGELIYSITNRFVKNFWKYIVS